MLPHKIQRLRVVKASKSQLVDKSGVHDHAGIITIHAIEAVLEAGESLRQQRLQTAVAPFANETLPSEAPFAYEPHDLIKSRLRESCWVSNVSRHTHLFGDPRLFVET